MSGGMEARWLSPDSYPEWSALVAEAPGGSVYSTPGYLDTLCRATGGSFRILGAYQNDELFGGVGVYQEGKGWSARVAPRLLLFYNGFVLRAFDTRYPSAVTSRHLKTLDALEKVLRAQGWGEVMFRSRHPIQDARVFARSGWKVWPTYSYEVPLDDLEALWERTENNVRRLVRRGDEAGLEVTCDQDFDSFWRMHVETHERKGAPIYLPYEAFRAYFDRLRESDLGRLYHARLPDGRSAAGALVLAGGHPVTHTVSAAAEEEFLSTGASAFLRWRAFQDLADDGYRANDLTGADLGPVTRFKSQLGGDLAVCLKVALPPTPAFRFGRAMRRARSLPRRTAGGVVRRALRLRGDRSS